MVCPESDSSDHDEIPHSITAILHAMHDRAPAENVVTFPKTDEMSETASGSLSCRSGLIYVQEDRRETVQHSDAFSTEQMSDSFT